jgi:hypothetical protein
MPWEVRLLADLKIVETTYTGRVTPQDLEKAAIATLSLARENETNRYLGDCTGLESGHSLVDLFDLVSSLNAGPVDRRSKEAILLPTSPDVAAEVQFYETTSRNRGLNVRVFRDRHDAIAWLSE